MSIELMLRSSFVFILFISLAQDAVGKNTDSSYETSCSATCNSNNGRCGADGICRCHQGWHGENCDQCLRAVGCRHGTCEEPGQCICLEGYGGRHCQLDMMYCEHHHPCRNGATCVNDRSGSFTCQCSPGFMGKTCRFRKSPIHPPIDSRHKPSTPVCLNGGICSVDNCETCFCPKGFAGSRCESRVRMCAAHPCANGGRCVDFLGDYLCQCANGFNGRHCEKDVDECSIIGDGACENGGRCVNLKGSYSCTCRRGYEGARCDKLIQRTQATNTPSTRGRGEQKRVNPALKVLIQKKDTSSLTSPPKQMDRPKKSSTQIKYTQIVQRVEVNAINSDVASPDSSEQASISIVQAVTFAFLGVAVLLFVIIGLVVWMHHTKKKRFGSGGWPCPKQELDIEKTNYDDNRSSTIVDDENEEIVETSTSIATDTYNLMARKTGHSTSPSAGNVPPVKSRRSLDYLYVSFPQNNGICPNDTNLNSLTESTHVS